MKILESLIIVMLLILLSNLGRGRQKRRQPPAQPGQQQSAPTQQTLTRQVRQLFDEMLQNDASSQRSSRQQAPGQRRARPSAKPAAQECGYCTGEVEVAQSVAHKSELTPMHAIVPQNDVPVVDIAVVQQEMGLSDLQNAVFWQEILAKPPALRGNRRR